jgi:hypothetical protein
LGQIATRRQAITGSETTITNRIPYLPVDLAAEVLSTDKIDLKLHRTAV